ncbi:chromosome partitioning protein ParA [Vibrio sp. SM6]|uniref:Chromosome partitioning protein ParA n=1 Tax=Vibrio agarilyticus TaxID=2726741 RepID=A0A7X8YFP4_9VIBR|nr:chromosome partitioning protein ParA [Vibrio agarilyticus]NLS11561.1 chromosome partitioning protein ParA [Vibrio agarilyticus]
MVSIQGLPPSVVRQNRGVKRSQQAASTNKVQGAEVARSEVVSSANTTTKVATAVAHSLVNARSLANAQWDENALGYDLPQGRARQALESYMDVMNQSKKEQLAQLLGVDIYI